MLAEIIYDDQNSELFLVWFSRPHVMYCYRNISAELAFQFSIAPNTVEFYNNNFADLDCDEMYMDPEN